jgi:hypothetical protein
MVLAVAFERRFEKQIAVNHCWSVTKVLGGAFTKLDNCSARANFSTLGSKALMPWLSSGDRPHFVQSLHNAILQTCYKPARKLGSDFRYEIIQKSPLPPAATSLAPSRREVGHPKRAPR